MQLLEVAAETAHVVGQVGLVGLRPVPRSAGARPAPAVRGRPSPGPAPGPAGRWRRWAAAQGCRPPAVHRASASVERRSGRSTALRCVQGTSVTSPSGGAQSICPQRACVFRVCGLTQARQQQAQAGAALAVAQQGPRRGHAAGRRGLYHQLEFVLAAPRVFMDGHGHRTRGRPAARQRHAVEQRLGGDAYAFQPQHQQAFHQARLQSTSVCAGHSVQARCCVPSVGDVTRSGSTRGFQPQRGEPFPAAAARQPRPQPGFTHQRAGAGPGGLQQRAAVGGQRRQLGQPRQAEAAARRGHRRQQRWFGRFAPESARSAARRRRCAAAAARGHRPARVRLRCAGRSGRLCISSAASRRMKARPSMPLGPRCQPQVIAARPDSSASAPSSRAAVRPSTRDTVASSVCSAASPARSRPCSNARFSGAASWASPSLSTPMRVVAGAAPVRARPPRAARRRPGVPASAATAWPARPRPAW